MGKGKAKAKPKREKKEVEEDDKPRMEAPNNEEFEEKKKVIQDKIDKLQKESAALQQQIAGRSAGKEDFFAKKAAIVADRDVISKQMDALQEQKEQIRKILGDKKTEQAEAKAELGKMKKSMNFTSAEDIENRIRTIEWKMTHESIPLKQEKDFMAEIKELKKNRPKLSQLANMQDKVQNFDAGGDLREKQKEINEQLAVLREQKGGFSAKLKELSEERQAQLGDFGEIAGQN